MIKSLYEGITVLLKKIQISHYRSCLDTIFEPNQQLSSIIGPNGTGKTNILTAILLLRSLLMGPTIRYGRNEKPATSVCEIKTWFDVEGKTVIHNAELDLYTDEHNRDEIISSKETLYLWDFTGSKKKWNIPLMSFMEFSEQRELFGHHYRYSIGKSGNYYPRGYFWDDKFSNKLRKRMGPILAELADFIYNMKYYGASQFTDPSRCPISFEVERDGSNRRGISLTKHKRFLFDVYQEHRLKTEKFIEYISLVNYEGIGLIDDINFEEIHVSSSEYNVMTGGKVKRRERDKILVVPQFVIGNKKLSPSQLSEGTFKTLALLFYLVTDTSSFLLIEEPEVCVHHGLLSSIVELIKLYSQEKQIIITTHSDSVLDELEVENVYRVTRDDMSGTKVFGIGQSLKNKEIKALRKYLQTDGSLGEYWKYGNLENE